MNEHGERMDLAQDWVQDRLDQLTKERDSLRTELDKLRCAYGNVCDNAAITEKRVKQLEEALNVLIGKCDLAESNCRDQILSMVVRNICKQAIEIKNLQ